MLNFVNNVNAFWNWFQHNHNRLSEFMWHKDTNNILAEISPELDKVFNGIPFQVGGKYGEINLMLSPEGDMNRLLLARYWKEQAPQIQGWAFFHLKQPSESLEFGIRMNNGVDINLDDFDILATPNVQSRRIDIEIFCKKLLKLDRESQFNIAFLMIDECLGEGYTETTIGNIDIARKDKKGMIPLKTILSMVTKTFKENGWELFESPDKVYSGYQLQPNQSDNKKRDDILFGSTSYINIINDYFNGNSRNYDYVRSVGAEYMFIKYNHEHIQFEEKVVFRGEIEDTLEPLLQEHKLGYLIGGATGIAYSYIDVIIFDADRFNDLIGGLAKKFKIEFECVPFRDLI